MHARQRACDEFGVHVGYAAHAQGDVDVFVEQVEAAVRDEQLHAYARVVGEEARQAGGDEVLGDLHRCAQAHDAARFGALARDGVFGGAGFGEHGLAVGEELAADFGDGELACGALHQHDAEVVLELGHAPAQARLGDAERAPGGGESAVFGHGGEEGEVVEVAHDRSAGRTMRPILGDYWVIGITHNLLARHLPLSKEIPMKLLQLDSSPLATHSVTRELAAAVVAQYRRDVPGVEVTYRDLAADALPHWTPLPREAVATLAPEIRAEVERNESVMQEFLSADVIVIGAPMYNFGIPSQLKAWIDRIAVAGRTFRYTAQGPEGLAVGKRVVVLSGRGGFYADTPLQGADFQEAYLL